jgi:hypothetical protein
MASVAGGAFVKTSYCRTSFRGRLMQIRGHESPQWRPVLLGRL